MGNGRKLAAIALLCGFAGAGTPQYVYFPSYPLTPISPQAPAECDALQAGYTKIQQTLAKLHDDCLQASHSSQLPGQSCSKSECQNLHDERDKAQAKGGAAVSACRADVAALLRAREARAHDEALREAERKARRDADIARAQADDLRHEQARLDEAQRKARAAALARAEAAARAAAVAAANAASAREANDAARRYFPTAAPTDTRSAWREQTRAGSNGGGSGTSEVGRSGATDWRRQTALPTPAPANPANAAARINRALDEYDRRTGLLSGKGSAPGTTVPAGTYTGSSRADVGGSNGPGTFSSRPAAPASSPAAASALTTAGGKVRDFLEKWVQENPNAGAALDNLKSATGAAAASGTHDVLPGLAEPGIAGGLGTATAVGGVVVNAGVGALDPDVAVGAKAIWDRRNGAHPADLIDTNEGTSTPDPNAPKGRTPK